MHSEGVRMAFVDTARSNTSAIKFFKHMGYGRPEAEVWMSKDPTDPKTAKQQQTNSPRSAQNIMLGDIEKSPPIGEAESPNDEQD